MDPKDHEPKDTNLKPTLHRYLSMARSTMLWKLEGLDEGALRRPMTPTATNLLGLAKHLAGVEYGYFQECFGRPMPQLDWMSMDAEPNADMYATADESVAEIIALYRDAVSAADAVIDELPLDAPARVPWWGERADTTLGVLMVHMLAETNRHVGHADIVREQLDGSIGHRQDAANLPGEDAEWWAGYHAMVSDLAERHR